MTHLYQVTIFRAQQLQKLRNVTMHSPSLIQIISGSKKLFQHETTETLSPSKLLLCEASTNLSFENLPDGAPFLSRVFSFHYAPSPALLALSEENAQAGGQSWVINDKPLEQTLTALFSLDLTHMSQQTQRLWLAPLYQQLAERGALHLLFTSSSAPVRQQITRYLSQFPSQAHPLEDVASRFAMSRATLIRKLKKEGTQYRELLADVRLNHALDLMQSQPWSVIQLAQMCGYQSEERFSQRFRSKFGLTPSDYMRTLVNDSAHSAKRR